MEIQWDTVYRANQHETLVLPEMVLKQSKEVNIVTEKGVSLTRVGDIMKQTHRNRKSARNSCNETLGMSQTIGNDQTVFTYTHLRSLLVMIFLHFWDLLTINSSGV